MSGYTPVEQIYKYFREARGVVVDPDLAGPGDLYVAFQRARPQRGLGRWIWTTLESVAPWLLLACIRLVVRLQLYRHINENWLRGNVRAKDALQHGATYAVIDNALYVRDARYLLVKDVTQTLAELAAYHRQQLPIPLVAITGSNGKTTTKELVRQVLSAHYAVTASPHTANTLPDVSKLILSIQPQHTMAVAEMGITGFSELPEMCQVAQPTSGLITNIRAAHLRQLKTLDGVQKAKSELFIYLRAQAGHIFLNLDNARVVAAAQGYTRVTTYGAEPSAQIRGEVVKADPYLRVRCYLPSVTQPIEIQTPLAGVYNLSNVLAALAVGYFYEVPVEKMIEAIETYQPLANRSQVIISGTNQIILDAYNANLGSMQAALDNFIQLEASNKVLILGDMWDLGKEMQPAHRSILEQVRALNPAQAVFIGPQFWRARLPDFGLYFRNVEAAKLWYKAAHFENATILIKGAGRYRLKDLLS